MKRHTLLISERSTERQKKRRMKREEEEKKRIGRGEEGEEKDQNISCGRVSVSIHEHIVIIFTYIFDPMHPQWVRRKGV